MKQKILCSLIILIFTLYAIKTVPQGNDNSAVVSSNKFAIALFKHLDQDKNLFFSPLSISTALSITVNGAQTATLKSIKNTLKIRNDLTSYNADFKNLLSLLDKNRIKDSIELSLANSLWMQQDYKFKNNFIEISKDYYNSGLNQTNYRLAEELESSRIRINKWVEEKTNDKIKNLIKPGILDTTTRLVITNAIYFKGRWLYQFDVGYTTKETFYSMEGESKADFMKVREAPRTYYEENGLKILELPYLGDEFSMLIILPNERDGIKDLENIVSLKKYTEWIKNLKQETVDVSIPKFKLESEFKLSETLSQMGMRDAFSNDADFSGMIEYNEVDRVSSLKISEVIHKSFIDLNEVGTEAAAATAVMFVYPTEMSPPVENKKVFNADHPFIFLIKENSTDAILFLGRVVDPNSE